MLDGHAGWAIMVVEAHTLRSYEGLEFLSGIVFFFLNPIVNNKNFLGWYIIFDFADMNICVFVIVFTFSFSFFLGVGDEKWNIKKYNGY